MHINLLYEDPENPGKPYYLRRSDGSAISPKRTLIKHFGRRGSFMRLRAERFARWDALGSEA